VAYFHLLSSHLTKNSGFQWKMSDVHAKHAFFWLCSLQSSDQLAEKSLHRTAADHLRSGISDTLWFANKLMQLPKHPKHPFNPPKFLTKCLKPKWSFTKVEAKCSPFFLLYNPSSVALWLWFCLVKFSWNAETVKLSTLVWCLKDALDLSFLHLNTILP